ncbi:MerR family transcriptional regulator [Mongoliimonas terrestris]|uniref:MerR family transcriptional regulator n=1 Tax=Mongoliimonas terrestris TaxID=1709001 RepID=UPI000949A7E2|nr:MerR family transcriptional regulator [Mongoliimonas terrestris]
MDKSPDAFRTISEVAEDLDLPQHVLRFWETRFTQIRPMKRGGGRRYYRPDDVELLRGIRHLLYGEGYTIKGVQRILKEQGVRFVMEIWRNPGMPIPVETARAGQRRMAAAAGEPDDAADEAAFLIHDNEAVDDEGADDPVRAEVPVAAAPLPEEVLPAGILPDDVPPRGGFRFMERFRSHDASHPTGALSREDIRRLQSTLFELLECKRLLDQTR